jgi:F-type H+/Na+-transporting ATPase subunit alpha
MFAGTNGYLDELPIQDVQRFEREFLEMMDLRYPEVLNTIAEVKDLSKDIEAKLHTIVKEFVQKFKGTVK